MNDRIDQEQDKTGSKRNFQVAAACSAVFCLMVGAAFAAVPLYQLFCQVTGYGGTTQRAEQGVDTILDREIIVRFDANIAPDLPWEFAPKQKTVRVKIGQMTEVFYQAQSTADSRTTGASVFNVTPFEVGSYFSKVDCFCFTEQVLASGETVNMPVLFYIDPEMDSDENLKNVKEITLSYTFFKSEEETESESAAVVPEKLTDEAPG